LIRELLAYLSEKPQLSVAKTFGHLAESISLLSREKRCRKNWAPHRNQCKHFIKDHLKEALHFDSILVLGSGPLHEIPIEILAHTFKKVVLVDIVHLQTTKTSLAHLKNLTFIEHDITEIEAIVQKEGQLIDKVPQAFLNENWGMVLSVNIMSQLPLHLNSYIKKRLKNKFSEVQVKNFLEAITRNHLVYLKSFHCPSLLITDTQTEYYDKNESILETDINYTHLDLPTAIESWYWNVAPIPELQKDVGMKMLVAAFILKSH
jgi:hypothetical protein